MPITASSSIERVYYDAKERALKVVFRATGKTYIYEGVGKDVYDALMEADSVGRYFNANIRDRYPFHEI